MMGRALLPLHLLAAVMLLTAPPAGAAQASALEEGMRLYHEGRRATGEHLEAAVRGDISMRGAKLACVQCHRRSGYGSSESSVVIPPIVGTTLFTAQHSGFARDYRDGRLGNLARPAYTVQSLGRALRDGIDASGRPLAPAMPRYLLSDREVAALAAYLNTLGSGPSPGINSEEIHFATVIAPSIDSGRRQALQAVLDAYSAAKNSATRNEAERARHAPFQKRWAYSAYRKWTLHTWQLHGPEASWGAQLRRHYQEQPVFALLGGIGDEQWQAVHDFCEAERIPCLFPHIATPPRQQPGDFYALYFSAGLRLEAQTLAADLNGAPGKSLVQLRRADTAQEAAQELSRRLAGQHGLNADEVSIDDAARLDAPFVETLLAQQRPDILVLWLRQDELAVLDLVAASPHAPQHIYLSSTLAPQAAALSRHALAPRIRLLHPFLLPDEEGKTLRFRTWARQAGIALSDPRLQADAYFAATLAGEALAHIRNNQSREYFIERIEHMTDSMLNTSYYPRLALAPGQRYAAKGAYIWQLDQPPAAARWVVP